MSTEFDKAYNHIPDTIEFNPAWMNNTGYFDHAVEGEHAPDLKFGEIVKSITPAGNNRRLILIGTPLGNVVLFDRYTDAKNGIVVTNCSNEFSNMVGGMSGQLTEDVIHHCVGEFTEIGTSLDNIGKVMKTIFETWGMVEA